MGTSSTPVLLGIGWAALCSRNFVFASKHNALRSLVRLLASANTFSLAASPVVLPPNVERARLCVACGRVLNREQHTLTVSSQLQLQRQKRFAGKLGRYIFGGHRRFGAASSNGLAERQLLCVVGLLGRHPKSRRVASLLACLLFVDLALPGFKV